MKQVQQVVRKNISQGWIMVLGGIIILVSYGMLDKASPALAVVGILLMAVGFGLVWVFRQAAADPNQRYTLAAAEDERQQALSGKADTVAFNVGMWILFALVVTSSITGFQPVTETAVFLVVLVAVRWLSFFVFVRRG